MFTKDKDNKIAPILVYATEEALNEQPNLLSSALQVGLYGSFFRRGSIC